MRTFVIGDIHGAYRALIQCLERSAFDRQADRLIVLGDVCDGWPEVHLCIDELLKIEHLDYILGNHDQWALSWAKTGKKDEMWLTQGGWNTLVSYGHKKMPQRHAELLSSAKLWVESDKKLFVHAGIDTHKPMNEQTSETMLWDRMLIQRAYILHLTHPEHAFSTFEEIYIGHTTTQLFNSDVPLKLCNVWALDTGAGWSGRLTIMDVATKQYWQSEPTPGLYPQEQGRS